MATTQTATYAVDDETVVQFEFEPVAGFVPAGAGEIAGLVRDAIAPALAGASAVLAQVRELRPDGVDVKFGIKVTGTTNWIVAKAATEGNFEVTLSWRPAEEPPGAVGPVA